MCVYIYIYIYIYTHVYIIHTRPMSEIVGAIVGLRFNCVRLPYSLDLVFKDKVLEGTKGVPKNGGRE